jgi:DNA polymerase I-like protein with 3'-5' exonuclease and polymerase domains
MGTQALADKLGCDASRATALRNAIRAAIPDINSLDKDCKRRFELGLPIKTLGGRFVNCEPPSHGRVWAYKALNLLIQGSASDQTKEAIIYADKELKKLGFYSRILGSVHDEINLCAPIKWGDEVKFIMDEAANALPCDVPMGITMGIGNNWAEASK